MRIIVLFFGAIGLTLSAFNVRANEPPPDDFRRSSFQEHLGALREPQLQPATTDPANEVYRLVILPSFDHPVSIRVSSRTPDAAVVTVRTTTGRGGYEPGVLATERVTPVAPSELEALRTTMGDRFWRVPTDEYNERRDVQGDLIEPVTCTDGALFVLEAVRGGRYHIVMRACSFEPEVRAAVHSFRPYFPRNMDAWMPP